MDEIEYLEEYEDLILPTMSTQAATTKGRNRTQLVTMADDDDSSSIDQDIFDSLFDDNSDDESVMHNKKGPTKLSQRSERSSRISRVSMDSLDMLVKELGEPFNPNADGSKSTNRNTPKQHNIKVTQPIKTVQKSTSTTTMAKASHSPTPVFSGSIKTINKLEAAKAIAERNIKAKSVATVRPTVQQNLGQATKSMNANENALPTTRILQGSRSSGLQHAKITSGSANSSKVASPTPSTSRKQISAATSTTGSNSNLLNSSKSNTPVSKRIVERSQTTIIKPEKPQIKDPAEDPLSLENIEHESDSDSDSFIYSDVSADSFVTLSDVDFEERHIIDLSNDSNYERVNLDKIRGSTPSPTVSDDYKSDKEDSPTKMLSNFDEKFKDGSVLESNVNEAAKSRVRQYVEGEATTSRQRKHDATSTSHDKSMNVQQQTPTTKDTLMERIDTVLSTTSVNVDERKVVENHIDEVEPDMEIEVVTDNKADADERVKQTNIMPDSANACDSQMDDTAIAKPDVIQEPSTNKTMEMEMDMHEIVEEVVEKQKFIVDNEEGEKTFAESNDNTTNEAISIKTVNNAVDMAKLEVTEEDKHNVKATENIDEMVVVSEQLVETVEDLNTNTEDTAVVLQENNANNQVNENSPSEAGAVSDNAIESTINKTTNLCEAAEVENKFNEIENPEEVQEKIGDETKSDSEIKIDGENVNPESETEKAVTNPLTEKDTEQVNFDSKSVEIANKYLQLEKCVEQCNITDADTKTTTEETEQGQKCEKKNESTIESANLSNEHEQDCATSSKNVKELQEEEQVVKAKFMKKNREADKQRLSLRRPRTPTSAKLTESITQNHAPIETDETEEVERKATAYRSEKDTDITDTKRDSSVDKLDADVHGDNIKKMEKRPPSSRSKCNTPKVDDNRHDVETDKTESQMQRKFRHGRREDTLRSDSRNERKERSQTPRGRKVQSYQNASVDAVEKSQTGVEKNEVSETASTNEKDAVKVTNEITADKQLENIDETPLEKCKTSELHVNEQVTPRPDKRVRGLVVSLKKTDLSKVLNEKLLRNIHTHAKSEVSSALEKSETVATITVDETKIDTKEDVISKGESKETMPSVVEEKEAGVQKFAEETNKDLKSENTTEKAKEDIKHDKHKDKPETSRKDEKSGSRSRGHSRYEKSRSKSKRDRTNDRSVEKPSEHTKSVKLDKAEHSPRHDKSVIKHNKDSRFEKSPDDAKRYSRSEKSTERSKRDSKYERSGDRAKRDSKEERTVEKSKTDSKESTDTTKKISKEESSLIDSKYEKLRGSVKKETSGKSEYKTKSESKEEHSKSFTKGSIEKTPEKSKGDSKRSTETSENVSKDKKSENSSKMDSKEEKSVETLKNETAESAQKTKHSSKETKVAHSSRYDKSTERVKKDSKDERSDLKEYSDSKEKTSEKAKIDSKHGMSSDRSRKVSKEDQSSSDSKEAKSSEKSKRDSTYDKSTEGLKKDSQNRKPETTNILEEENPANESKEEILEKTQESTTKSEEKSPDYRKMKWKNDKYSRKTKSAKDNKEVSDYEMNAKIEAESGAGTTKQFNIATSMEIETADNKTVEPNINAELSVESFKNDTIQNCVEESDSKSEEITVESQIEHKEEQTNNEVIIEEQIVDKIQMECCESHEVTESTHENKVNEEIEASIESVEKVEEGTAIAGSIEKAEEGTANAESIENAGAEKAIAESIEKADAEKAIALSTDKYKDKRGKRGRFSKTKEKKVKRKPTNVCSVKTETETKAKEDESFIENSVKMKENKPEDKTGEIEMAKAHESSVKTEEDKTEIAVSNSEDTENAATIAESSQAIQVDEAITEGCAKSRSVVGNAQEIVNTNAEGAQIVTENVGARTGATIENANAVESPNAKTTTNVVLDSTDKLETQNETQTVEEIAKQNLNEENVIANETALDVEQTVQIQANAGTLEETVNTASNEMTEAEGAIESVNVKTNSKITNKIVDQNVVAKAMEGVESSNKNETNKTHEVVVINEATTHTQAANEGEGNTENADQSNEQEFSTQQTPTTKDIAAVKGPKEPAASGSGSSGTTKALRHKHARTLADIQIIAQSSQLQTADEDEQEGATRRSMRTRAADHSPCNRNEIHKKSSKGAAANQTQSSALTNSNQKSAKEQPHSSRSSTATPTTNLARKRMRDHTPNSTAEHSEPDKSPSKKLKWESARKYSRMHTDDADTSEGDTIAAAVAQQGAKLFSTRGSPASSKSAHEIQAKLTDTKDAKGSKSAQVSAAPKQSNASEVKKSATSGNLNTSKKSMNASHSATKAETAEVKRKQELEKLSTAATTTTDAYKKRRTELDVAKAVKRYDDTQQKQISTTHKSAVKQAVSLSPASTTTTVARTEHAHAASTTGVDAADPLQLPVKRFRRLQAIDGYETFNASEERKEIKGEESQNKTVTVKRKSLRPDGSKTTETTHKLTTKQIQQSHQQQHYQKSVTAKPVETTTLSLKDRKIVVPNKTVGKNASNTDKNASKSPTKSPGSKVITFKEWLEQQKKSTVEEGGEEVLFEPDESAICMDKILTATTAELKRANTSVANEVSTTSAKQKSSMPTVIQTPAATEASISKDAKKRINARDAAKRKREAAFTPNKESQQSIADVLAKQTPPAAKHGRIERVVTPTTTQAGAHFKRPSLPQRMPRHTPTRFNNRTPTPTDARTGLHSTQQHARVEHLGTKVKLRKLRVRINRSTVAAYFKNLNTNKLKEPVAVKPVATTQSMSNISFEKDPLALPQQSVVAPLKTATTTKAAPPLPTLTARPNVIAAPESNDATESTPLAMPTLTKVPTGVQEKSPKKSAQEKLKADAPQAAAADQQQFGSNEELSLLTPMKTVTTPQISNSLRAQHQQQQLPTTTAPEVVHEKRTSTTSSSDTSSIQRALTTGKPTNSSIISSSSTITAASSSSSISSKDTQIPFTPVVPKEELPDEQTLPKHPSQAPTGITTAASVDNATITNSLASRTLAIAAATNSALNQMPTSDASGYYGLTPTQLDTNGTRLYSFLHPAKYNRNHGCVLLDYCCPNLDGPMPAIDPTRIHAQVQAGVRELPAYIVMTTKLITRADLEANKNVIPASIRHKVEKITADASNATANHASTASVSGAPNILQTSVPSVLPPAPQPPPTVPVSKPSTTTLTPTITALQKHLPSTTIITPKMMPASTTATMATQGTSPTSQLSNVSNVSDYQRSMLRTSVRQFDARLKKYYYRIAMLSFSDRQTIIDGIINSTTLTPKDVDCAVRLIDEYAAQISKMPQTSAASTAKSTTPAIQSVSNAITTQTTNTVVRTTTIQQQVQKHNTQSSKNQVAVLDKDNSLLGYQLVASPMPMSKSTISTRSSIMSTSITGTANASLPNATSTSSGVFASLKSAQESPRIFYTKTPMQTSTPIATANSSTPQNDGGKTMARRGTPRMGRDVTIRQIPQKLSSLPVSSTTTTATPPTARRLPTLTRNPHLTASSSSSADKNISETITTRSAVTISSNAPKRMTRATAAAKVIVITQNSDGNSAPLDECILPDGHENTEIKREKSDDDFVGGN